MAKSNKIFSTPKKISALGKAVSKAWNSKNRNPIEFSTIAEMEIAKSDFMDWFNPDEIFSWYLRSPNFIEQKSPVSGFGEPPITVYEERDFFIEIYFWKEPLISIHDHAFSGAFAVLRGASINCIYDFKKSRTFSDKTMLGELKLKKVEHLHPGSVRRIIGGNKFIHDVWHYVHPTISMVVRTKREIVSQNVYHPKMAADTLAVRASDFGRKLALLEQMILINRSLFETELLRLIEEASFYELFVLYMNFIDRPEMSSLTKKIKSKIRKIDPQKYIAIVSAKKKINKISTVFWPGILSDEARLITALQLIGVSRVEFVKLFKKVFQNEWKHMLELGINELKSSGSGGEATSLSELKKIQKLVKLGDL